MNKSNLNNGKIVTLRYGDECLIVNDMLIKNNFRFNTSLEAYNEDLTHKENKNYDIVKVQEFNKESVLWKREEIDWSKVPVETKVLVSDNENNWYEHLFIDYEINLKDEIIKFKAIDIRYRQIHNWKYCKLVKEPKQKITFNDIDKKLNNYCKKHFKNCDSLCGPCVAKYILDNYNLTIKVPKIENDKCSKCETKVVYSDNEYEPSLKHATCPTCGISWTIGK